MKAIILASFFSIALSLISCSTNNKLDKKLFNMVEMGMSINEVKGILGEPDDSTLTIDLHVNYYYYIHDDFLTKEYATVQFDKAGRVFYTFYGNPN